MSHLRKLKRLKKFLGKDFEVKSCYGHIRDLEKDDMGIDINNNFKPRIKYPMKKQSSKRTETACKKSR